MSIERLSPTEISECVKSLLKDFDELLTEVQKIEENKSLAMTTQSILARNNIVEAERILKELSLEGFY